MTTPKAFRPSITVSLSGVTPGLVTHQLFDANHREPAGSPLDEFHRRLNELNVLVPPPGSFQSTHGQLFLLGTISAVESYVRTLLRRLILLDVVSQTLVQDQHVSYGAALHLPKDLMPEAILERVSFTSQRRIVDALRLLLGVKGELPSDLEESVAAYANICQLRNCAVHRFGKLGSNNAIALGIEDHKHLMEKPLRLDYVALQSAIAIAAGFARTLNNFLFNEMLARVPPNQWSGDYRRDAPLFKRYYAVFSDRTSSRRSPQPFLAYRDFKKQLSAWTNPPAKVRRAGT